MPQDREKRLAYMREYNRTPERIAARVAWRQANRDRENAERRLHRNRGKERPRKRRLPGSPEDQDGLCYLCGSPLPADRSKMAMDHDHRHCKAHQSCSICRRGLAHIGCNTAIGIFGDDPEVIRRVADNLERAQAAFKERLRKAHQVLPLFEIDDPATGETA